MQERITTAGILVRGGKYLIAKREEKGAIGGLWEFPGGKNRYSETEVETLKREFMEELGIPITVGSLVHTHDFTNKDTRYHLKAYWVTAPPSTDFSLTVHSEYRWVGLDELESFAFAPSDQAIVKTLLSSKNMQD